MGNLFKTRVPIDKKAEPHIRYKYDFIYLDTHALSFLADTRNMAVWHEFLKYLVDTDLFLAIGENQVAELSDNSQRAQYIAEVLISRGFRLKATYVVLAEEVKHYPNGMQMPYFSEAFAGYYFSPDGRKKIIESFQRDDLVAARQLQKQFRDLWLAEMPNHIDTVRKDQIKQYRKLNNQATEIMRSKIEATLNRHHPEFMNSIKSGSEALRLSAFPSLLLSHLYQFYKYMVAGHPAKPSDFGDFHNIGLIHYANIGIVDRETANHLIAIQRNEDLLPNTRIETIDFITRDKQPIA